MRRGNVFAYLDWFTVGLFLVLVFLGWINIYSAVYSEANPGILNLDQRYGRQFLWICAALLIALTIIFIDQRFYDFSGYIIYGFIIFLLIAVLFVGREINGARSWFALGAFQFQPSEFAKPAVALALAKYLSTFNVSIQNTRTFFISAALIFSPAVLILLQPDTGSALVFFAFILAVYREGFSVSLLLIMVSLILIFLLELLLGNFIVLIILTCAGFAAWAFMAKSLKNFGRPFLLFVITGSVFLTFRELFSLNINNYLLLGITMGVAGIFFIIRALLFRAKIPLIILTSVLVATLYSFTVDYAFENILNNYQQRRVNIMLGLESDPQGAGYNLNQSKIAIGSGGFSGKGYLSGTQTKLNFVPEQSTDFIFCTVGEEWGFVGSTAVIILFVVLLLRLLFLAERQRTSFARIYGYGLFSVFFLHFFVNIAMTIGLFPVIGIPLPFFSYGGSSLWAFTIMLFIFLRLDAGRVEYVK